MNRIDGRRAKEPKPFSWRREKALEVCVDNVESALNAYEGGARRLELCSSLNLGGLTPSLGLFRVVKKLISHKCQIFVMIRPKTGESYVYDDHDIAVMEEDIKIFRENGAAGFVFGCLNKNKIIDEKACSKLLKASRGLPCTFHRAFDILKNPVESMVTLIKLGFSRILTSGQEKTAFLGITIIRELVVKVKELGSTLIIVAGGGIDPSNIGTILERTGVEEFHGSARLRVAMPEEQSNDAWKTDISVVRELIKIAAVKCNSRV